MSLHLTSRHMLDEKVRHSLTSNQFLSKHCVRFYMLDAIEQLLYFRTDKPLEYISKYFKLVRNGLNVVNRSFGYVNATPRNRYAFSSLVEHVYSNTSQSASPSAAASAVRKSVSALSGGVNASSSSLSAASGATFSTSQAETLSADEFYQLILLLCEDFPESLAQIVYRILYFGDDTLAEMRKRHLAKKKKNQEADDSANSKDGSELSGVSSSSGGGGTTKPTFESLKKAFRIYFFFREFFNEILNLVFEHDTNGSFVTMDELLKHLNVCCTKNLQSHLNSHYDGTDKQELELKHMTPCYPSFDYFSQLLESFDGSTKVSFNQFCKLIFDDMTDPYRDIVRCMDLRCTPFTPKVAYETHEAMAKNIKKVLYFTENMQQQQHSRPDSNLQIVSSSNSNADEGSTPSTGRSRSSSVSSRSESDTASEKKTRRRRRK